MWEEQKFGCCSHPPKLSAFRSGRRNFGSQRRQR
nr:MAG TPA: hypothetical protein [Caudoviricetes sp.]